MKEFLIIPALALLLLTACSKESSNHEEAIECLESRYQSFTLNETDCIFADMYYHEGGYWTIDHCCVCDIIFMAFDCNGEPLCDFETGDCMEGFTDRAEFLFSFTYE